MTAWTTQTHCKNKNQKCHNGAVNQKPTDFGILDKAPKFDGFSLMTHDPLQNLKKIIFAMSLCCPCGHFEYYKPIQIDTRLIYFSDQI